MKKFFIKSTIFIFMVFFSIFGVIYLLPLNKDKYLGATVEKHKLLSETVQPRIIFSGDSNLAFGLDSALVKEKTGYNVVNMGLHGGLGLIYYLDELAPYLKRNDIVIFIMDYQNFFGDGRGGNTIIEITIFNPGIIRYYSKKNIKNFIINIPLTFKRRLRGLFSRKRDDMGFRRSDFNEFGDNVGHLGLTRPRFVSAPRTLPKRIFNPTVDLFNNFYDKWSREGVDIYISFSPLMEEEREKQVGELKILVEDMKKRLKLKIIGEPGDFIYPQKYFFDNIFHLNAVGRDLRTNKLIDRMKEYKELSIISH